MEPIVVTRTVQLPVPAAEVWRSIATAEGLAGWLGDEVAIDGGADLERGATGRAVDGGVERRLAITDVVPDRRVELAWWRADRPDVVSLVAIELTDDDGATQVTVTEQLLGGAVASIDDASVAHLTEDLGHAWDRRLRALVGETTLLPASR